MGKPPTIHDVAVVGAGLFGAAVARECALRGLTVVIVEANEVAGGASAIGRVLLGGGAFTGGDAASIAELVALAPFLVEVVSIDRQGVGAILDVTRLTQLYVIDALERGAALLVGSPVVRVGDARDEDGVRTLELADGYRVDARSVVMAMGAGHAAAGKVSTGLPLAAEARRVRVLELAVPPDLDAHVSAEHIGWSSATGRRLLLRDVSGPPAAIDEALSAALQTLGLDGSAIRASRTLDVAVPGGAREDGDRGVVHVSESRPGAHRAVAIYLAELLARARGAAGAAADPGEALPGAGAPIDVAALAQHFAVPELAVRGLVTRHGRRARDVLRRTESSPGERALVCACEAILEAEVRHVCRVEAAATLSDVARRTGLGGGHCNGLHCAQRAARIATDQRPAEARAQSRRFFREGLAARAPFLDVRDLPREELFFAHLSRSGFELGADSDPDGEPS